MSETLDDSHPPQDLNDNELVEGYFMLSCLLGLPSSYPVRALIDSGAMPTVIKEEVVPTGAIIKPTNVTISGVSNKKIEVAGITKLLIQIGNKLFTQDTFVIPPGAMTFPQGSAIILGANFLAPNDLGICASRWCLLHKTLPLKSLIPCKIGGSVYRALQTDTETSANSQSE